MNAAKTYRRVLLRDPPVFTCHFFILGSSVIRSLVQP